MKKALALILICCFLIFFSCCTSADSFVFGFDSFSVFNTYISVKLFAPSDDDSTKATYTNAVNLMKETLNQVEAQLSANKEGSDIYRFNAAKAGESVVVGVHTANCFNLAQQMYAVTEGAFNPAVYNLVDLWGFSARFNDITGQTMPYDRNTPSPPQQVYIDAFKTLTNFEDVIFDPDTNTLTKPSNTVTIDGNTYNVKLDFGGIGKGYACDLFKEIASQKGITRGYFNIGTSSISFLDNAYGKPFNVDMENPRAENFGTGLLTLKNISQTSISVSGDYQRFFEHNAKRYCHIIDAKSGMPTQSGLYSVLIAGRSAAINDCLTTALSTLDKSGAAVFVNSQACRELGVTSAVFVYGKEGKLAVASNADITITNNSAKGYNYDVYQGQATFNPIFDATPLVIAGLVLICVIGLVFLLVKRVKLSKNYPKKYDTKNAKFFEKADIIAYFSLFIVVIILFVSFVWTKDKGQLNVVEIYHDNILVYSFDFSSMTGNIKNSSYADRIISEQKEGSTIVTIFVDVQKIHFNKIEFSQNTVQVYEANCPNGDCKKAICTIEKPKDIILCIPHKLKIIGVGEGNVEVS